eukprot:TRINITY_DN8903_c0_g1_i1.p1 TRINITY_DN8903_c0_g1~~TRINITY_DN8903_c0_g1_i1.p1  ORF type:complete len:555 (+),score=74.22 TRINITY_DN8903_c0_g1_i1:118-1665(+)
MKGEEVKYGWLVPERYDRYCEFKITMNDMEALGKSSMPALVPLGSTATRPTSGAIKRKRTDNTSTNNYDEKTSKNDHSEEPSHKKSKTKDNHVDENDDNEEHPDNWLDDSALRLTISVSRTEDDLEATRYPASSQDVIIRGFHGEEPEIKAKHSATDPPQTRLEDRSRPTPEHSRSKRDDLRGYPRDDREHASRVYPRDDRDALPPYPQENGDDPAARSRINGRPRPDNVEYPRREQSHYRRSLEPSHSRSSRTDNLRPYNRDEIQPYSSSRDDRAYPRVSEHPRRLGGVEYPHPSDEIEYPRGLSNGVGRSSSPHDWRSRDRHGNWYRRDHREERDWGQHQRSPPPQPHGRDRQPQWEDRQRPTYHRGADDRWAAEPRYTPRDRDNRPARQDERSKDYRYSKEKQTSPADRKSRERKTSGDWKRSRSRSRSRKDSDNSDNAPQRHYSDHDDEREKSTEGKKKQDDAKKDVSEEDVASDGDIEDSWVRKESRRNPGKTYLFNTITGESRWVDTDD